MSIDLESLRRSLLTNPPAGEVVVEDGADRKSVV